MILIWISVVQPFAFASREFLREILVGKVVFFHVLYTIPMAATGARREHGTITLPGSKASLPEISVQEGWSHVREEAGKHHHRPEEEAAVGVDALLAERLRTLEKLAKISGKGVWSTENTGRIETIHQVSDPQALVDEYKEQRQEREPLLGIVEKVLSGDRLLLRLLLSPGKEHFMTVIALAGVRAPATKRTAVDGTEHLAEPLGEEAQQFVEERLLQRKVHVSLLGVSPQGQLIATVLHPIKGNIAQYLLEEGLARCLDSHSILLGPNMASLRHAEKSAKDAGKGLFRGHHTTAKASSRPSSGDLYTVSRVLNADTLLIRSKAGGGAEERRISLSSVRQPKPSDPKQSPYAADAREFVRKRLIGKHVKVSVDGKKPAQDGYEERDVVTLMHGNTNVALALVQAGYASVIRHRADDEDRSPIYDDLIAAEATAQKDGKGMWNDKQPPPKPKQYHDYSESPQTAKRTVAGLQRQKRIPAVVDFIKSGSRFSVLLPQENAKLTLVFSGIRVPRSARGPGETGEPFGREAHDLAAKRCMQRDVEIDIETIDKAGGFIGTVYVGGQNFSKVLLEDGLATVHAYSSRQSGNEAEYSAAEEKAKQARRGIWHDWDPSKEAAIDENGVGELEKLENGDTPQPLERRKDYRDVTITHIDPDTARIKLQLIGKGTSVLTELMSAFRAYHANKANDIPLPGPPKTGDLVAARFTADGEWYRAKIRRNDRENKQAEVVYIDYGNTENLPWSRLRPLTQAQFATTKLRPQAVDAVLAFLQFPPPGEYLADAVDFVADQTLGRQLVANVEYSSPEGSLQVSLLDPAVSKSLDQSINADVVREGLAMVPRKLRTWEHAAADTISYLRALEDDAKQERRGMWEYGDLTED